jgi:hypothetical protein
MNKIKLFAILMILIAGMMPLAATELPLQPTVTTQSGMFLSELERLAQFLCQWNKNLHIRK